ncbi:MAG: extracellular solute-binding protein [Telmatospirillum sp.]|nr:extracellular solute-binding protein [Telmatospirillum sp.]
MTQATSKTRRSFLAQTAAGASLALAAPALAQVRRKELIIGGPAGMTDVLKEDVFPSFERKYGCRVLFDGSSSLENLKKMQAVKDRPQFSVVLMDDPVMIVAQDEKLIEKIDPKNIPNIGAIVQNAIVRDGWWLSYKWPRASIAYNSKNLPGGTPSWAMLWDPKYKGKVMIPSVRATQIPFILAAAAHLETGKPIAEAQYDINAAFKKLATIRSNLLLIYNGSAQVANLIETGEATLGAGMFSSYTLWRKRAGAPVDLGYPQEGSFAMPSGIAKVAKAPEPELADAFISETLGAEYQKVWADKLYDTPTNPSVTLPPEVAAASTLTVIDWGFVAQNRNEWMSRFDREIAI